MTDLEKVIKGFECCQYSSKSHCDGCPYVYENLCNTNDCTADLASDALALLKEPEPVKPIYSEEKFGDLLPHCSACKKVLPSISQYGKSQFCHRCGKRVKWDG